MSRQLKDKFPHLETPLIWLDFWDYTQRLFLKGAAIEWLSPARFDEYYRQALELLDPAVAPIDLDRVIAAYLERNPGMKKSMTYRARPTYPLKALLGDAGLRSTIARLCETTADARKRRPLALAISAPLALLNMAQSFATGRPPQQVEEDDCERAAVYMTDFLGALGQPPGTFVLLVDGKGEAASPAYRHALKPLSNLTQHMRWHLALATQAPITDPMSAELVFTPAGLDGVWSSFPCGRDGAAALYAVVPADCEPETVLKTIATLRGRA
jgi:hypothetical protein